MIIRKYLNKNGKEITEGCKVKFSDGRVEKIYLADTGELGTDATNPAWIESGRAIPCQYGIYPLTNEETRMINQIESIIDKLSYVYSDIDTLIVDMKCVVSDLENLKCDIMK